MLQKLIYLGILFLAICFDSYAQDMTVEHQANHTPEIIQLLGQQLNTYQNKHGRVTVSNVNKLSVSPKSEVLKDLNVGISLLTQDDAVVSTGIGAGFHF